MWLLPRKCQVHESRAGQQGRQLTGGPGAMLHCLPCRGWTVSCPWNFAPSATTAHPGGDADLLLISSDPHTGILESQRRPLCTGRWWGEPPPPTQVLEEGGGPSTRVSPHPPRYLRQGEPLSQGCVRFSLLYLCAQKPTRATPLPLAPPFLVTTAVLESSPCLPPRLLARPLAVPPLVAHVVT